MEDRFNTPSTRAVELEVMGHIVRLAQDPNTKHVGTTVWDSSMVVAKYLERNSRSGEFARAKVAGKRVIELGAGCGLAGIGFALLGCDVVLTDQAEVLPLLRQNVERNGSSAQMASAGDAFLGSIGKMEVAELDWGNREHIAATNPPFDFIVGTDVVYVEHAVQELFDTMLLLSGRKTVILLGYEFRSTSVHERLHRMLRLHWSVKKVPSSKLDSKYQHASIDLFVMKRKRSLPQAPVAELGSLDLQSAGAASCTDSAALEEGVDPAGSEETGATAGGRGDGDEDQQASQGGEGGGAESSDAGPRSGADTDASDGSAAGSGADHGAGGWSATDRTEQEGDGPTKLVAPDESPAAASWEARRGGAMAAKLMASITIPNG